MKHTHLWHVLNLSVLFVQSLHQENFDSGKLILFPHFLTAKILLTSIWNNLEVLRKGEVTMCGN